VNVPQRYHLLAAFLLYLALIVYGSLVPFAYQELPLEEALQRFAAIPYLDLSMVSRADWVANLVLYLPLSFLGCAWLAGFGARGVWRYAAVLLVVAFCLAVAVAVEFTQLFFAPRTVSLNDLLAETLGTLGGVVLWLLGRRHLLWLWEGFAEGGRRSLLAAMVAYGLVYLALSLFPFDFVISFAELADKLASGRNGWLLAGDCEGWLRCTVRLLGDALAIAPLGVLIGLHQPRVRPDRVLIAGVVLGVVLELVQLLLASGSSQGLSALLRGLGLAAGTLGGVALGRHGVELPARILRLATPFAVLPYLLLLTALGGWYAGAWLSPGEVLGRLPELQWLPFYYHYYTSEPVAMASLLAHLAMYAPVGIALWARAASRRRNDAGRRQAWLAAVWAAFLALPIELGKLLVATQHPDLTNVLVGAAGAALAFGLAGWIERAVSNVRRVSQGSESVVAEGERAGEGRIDSASRSAKRGSGGGRFHRSALLSNRGLGLHPVGVLVSVAALLATVMGVAVYPMGQAWLILGLVGYGIYLWSRPSLWLFWLPLLLPLLDLSPYTGRLLLDEFDLLVLVTLVVGYWRVYPRPAAPWPGSLHALAVALLWLTWVVAMARGLWPALGADTLSLDQSHSPLEAWLVGKGLLWALLLVPLLRRMSGKKRQWLQQRLQIGMVAGLVLVTLAVLWERLVYVGLGDFDSVFRVTGTFSSMNTGGAYIEAFIAFTFPFLAVWVLKQHNRWLILLPRSPV